MKAILSIASIVASVGVIVSSALQLSGAWEKAHYLSMPLMGLVLLLQAVREWNSRRGVAAFSLAASLFVFVCAAVVVFL